MKHICWLNWNLTKAPLPSKYNYQSHVNSICECGPSDVGFFLSSPLTVHLLLTCGCISCAHDWLLLESFNTVFVHSCGNSNKLIFWEVNFYLTHPFLDLVSARSSSWQTAHARVGGVVWWTSTLSFTLALKKFMYTSSEVEVHTVYQRLFKKLRGKGLHSMQHLFFMLLLC